MGYLRLGLLTLALPCLFERSYEERLDRLTLVLVGKTAHDSRQLTTFQAMSRALELAGPLRG